MRKSILRFGALALMSLMSISAFAQTEGQTITLTGTKDAGQYFVLANKCLKLTRADGYDSSYEFPKVTYDQGTASERTVLGEFKSQTGDIYKVTEIGEEAFTGTVTSSVEIPATVTTIGKNAFSWVNSSACTIEFQNIGEIISIGEGAFMKKDATQENVDGATKTRNAGAAITIQANTDNEFVLSSSALKQLGNYAFAGVTFSANATKVLLGGIQEIPDGLFSGASKIGTVDFSDTGATGTGLKIVGNEAFKNVTITDFGYKDNDGKYYLPKQLAKVGESAFCGTSITNFLFSVTNKGQISDVGASAFEGCAWLDNAHFCNLFPATKNTVTYQDVYSGESVVVKNFTFGNLAFAKTKISGCYDFKNVSDNTFSNAFSQNTNLKVVNLNTDTKTIAAGALQGCTGLVKCDLPSGLEKIETMAFQNTNAFTSVFIPSSVEFIGEDAFTRINENSCSPREIKIQPKEATLANEISKVIESWKEYWTESGQTQVYHKDATKPIADYSKTDLYVPMGLSKSYATVKNNEYDWSNVYTSSSCEKLYTYGSVLTADFKIYNGCYQYTVKNAWDPKYTAGRTETPEVVLTGVKLSVEPLGTYPTKGSDYTKQFASDEKTLNIPQTVVREGENSSSNPYSFVWYTVVGVKADALQYTTVKDNVTYGLKEQIETVNIQANALNLGKQSEETNAPGVFTNYKKLQAVNFCAISTDNTKGWAGAQVAPKEARIGDRAFENCTSLTSFTGVDKDFTYTWGRIGSQAFLNCPFTTVTIPNNVEIIAYGAFSDTGLEGTVTLPFGLKEIASYAFANTGLEEISIPATVNKIGAFAFDGKLAEATEDELNEAGVRISGHIDGVSEVYAYWTDQSVTTDGKTTVKIDNVTIAPNAFGVVAEDPNVGDDFHTVVRALYIPDGSYSKYAEKAPFQKNDRMFAIGEGIIAKTEANPTGRLDLVIDPRTGARTLNIEDKGDITEFIISNPSQNAAVKYTRKVAQNVYNSLFVPFSVKGVGADYKIYKIFDTKVESDGTESIEYVALGEDEYTKPNVPYVIYPTTDEVVLTAVAFENPNDHKKYTYFATPADLATPRVTCSDAKNSFAFYGTYKEKFGDDDMTVESEDAFYSLTNKNRFNLQNDGTKSVKALRFWMTIKGKGADYYYVKGLELEDVTAIENLKANSLNAPMFDLMGRQITAPAKGQVYIQNGVKKLAK